MAWPLRRVFRVFWWILCTLTILALPLTIWEFSQKDYDIHYQAWFIGGLFVILSFPISVYEVAMHTEHYTRPRLQRHVIRILWMVPIYGVDAWLALRFRDAREYLDPIRECYEAYVIYNFYAYLMAYLEETVGDLEHHLSKKTPMQHLPVVRWLVPAWPMGGKFLLECKKGILNFVIMRPICTVLGFITDIFDLYGQGQIDFAKSYVYLAAITNFSQLWALYCLAIMYHKCHDELAPIRPLSKFLVVKAVVFVTFWQGVIIAILVYKGIISRESWTTYDQVNVASGIQDFLICIEMFFAALAHAYAFPPRVVENHASIVVDTSSTVLRLPHRAISAAVQAPANLISLFKGSNYKKLPIEPDEDGEDSKLALLTPDERETLDASSVAYPYPSIGIATSGVLDQDHQQLPTSAGLTSSSSGGSSGGGEQLQLLRSKEELHSRNSSGGSSGMSSTLGSTVQGGGSGVRGSGGMTSVGDGAGGGVGGKGVAGLAGRLLRVASGSPSTSSHDKLHELQQRSPPPKVDHQPSFGYWARGASGDGDKPSFGANAAAGSSSKAE